MFRSALCLLSLCTLPVAADPILYESTLEIEDVEFPVPMALTLVPESETGVLVFLQADLGIVQQSLPGLLSRRIEDDCDRELAVAVEGGTIEVETLRLTGQLQAKVYACFGGKRGARLLKQNADVSLDLLARLEDGGLVSRVTDIEIDPEGLSGDLMGLLGVTSSLEDDIKADIEKDLNGTDNCLSLPEEFSALDTMVTGGRFIDLGGGRIGAEIAGSMELGSQNFIRLMHVLGQNGALD